MGAASHISLDTDLSVYLTQSAPQMLFTLCVCRFSFPSPQQDGTLGGNPPWLKTTSPTTPPQLKARVAPYLCRIPLSGDLGWGARGPGAAVPRAVHCAGACRQPALIRPGRVDVQEEFGHATPQQVRRAARRWGGRAVRVVGVPVLRPTAAAHRSSVILSARAAAQCWRGPGRTCFAGSVPFGPSCRGQPLGVRGCGWWAAPSADRGHVLPLLPRPRRALPRVRGGVPRPAVVHRQAAGVFFGDNCLPVCPCLMWHYLFLSGCVSGRHPNFCQYLGHRTKK